jgi:hypothetical protein
MTNSTAAPFCLTPGWSMFNGFTIAVGSQTNCAMFIFAGWNVDSVVKYVFAVIACVLLAFSIEAIAYFRKWYSGTFLARKKAAEASKMLEVWRYVPSLLYGVQMFFAYMVMLLVMLYETIFFIALLVGFICGHALFSVYLPRQCECSPAIESAGDSTQLLVDRMKLQTKTEDVAHSPCCGGTSR